MKQTASICEHNVAEYDCRGVGVALRDHTGLKHANASGAMKQTSTEETFFPPPVDRLREIESLNAACKKVILDVYSAFRYSYQ